MILCSWLVSFHESARGNSEPKNQSLLLSGVAWVPETKRHFYGYGGLAFLRRSSEMWGWNLVAGGGPAHGFRTLSAGIDAWVWQNLRAGAGLGFAFPFREAAGNAIPLPIPEISLGYHFIPGTVAFGPNVTQNLFHGTRLNWVLGITF